MNIFTGIMLAFALFGLADRIFSLRWGLSESFNRGLMTMGTMVVPIVGVCTIGVEFIERHADAFAALSGKLFFDPTLIVGALLAPDLGGYFITEAMTSDRDILIMNGVVLGTLLGQAVCFQLPVFLASVGKESYPQMLKGFLAGITMIPAGMIAAEMIIRMDIMLFLRQFIPILAICALVAIGLYRIPEGMIRAFTILGRVIQIITDLMFAAAVLGVFIPQIRYADMDAVGGALMIVFKSAVIIAGSLVMSELILKIGRRQINGAARRMGVNEVSVICMMMNCATSLAILPMFDRMDDRGKMLNSAFSISGAYVLGGSMAFVSAVSSGYTVMVFLVCKFVSGLLSMYIMHRTER